MINVVGLMCALTASALSHAPSTLPASRPADGTVTVAAERNLEAEGMGAEAGMQSTLPDHNRRSGNSTNPQTLPARLEDTTRNLQATDSTGIQDTTGGTIIPDATQRTRAERRAARLNRTDTNNTNPNGTTLNNTNPNSIALNNTNPNGTTLNNTNPNGTTLNNTNPNSIALNNTNPNGIALNNTNPNGIALNNLQNTADLRTPQNSFNQSQNITNLGTYQGSTSTIPDADRRYNELKAQLDAQYAHMFDLKNELDTMQSMQTAKWEEYHALHQSYERQLKFVIADWVMSQSLTY